MSFSAHFELLVAPLTNPRWSWGAVRPDGTVFLRVWQVEARRHDSGTYMRLTNYRRQAEKSGELGFQERLRHINLIREGARCYLVMCVAKDMEAIPRVVKEFDSDSVFLAGKLVELDGDWWLEKLQRIPVREIICGNSDQH